MIAGVIIAALLVVAVLILAFVLILRRKQNAAAAGETIELPEQGPTGVVQNKIFSAAEYASWSGQQRLDYDNGLVPGAADHPTPRQSWLVQAEGNASSTDYLAPVVGGGGGNGVYAIPLEKGSGAGIDGSTRPETIYAMPVDAPKHILLDVDGYVAGGEMPRRSPSSGDIHAVVSDERGGDRHAVSNVTYGVPAQNDSSV